MTKTLVVAAIIAAFAQSANAATDWDPGARIGAAFTYLYRATHTAVGPAGASRTFTRESHVVVTGNPPGPVSRLRGRCIGLGTVETATSGYTMTGWCLLRDADGDMIVERFEEALPGDGAPASGEGVVRGGTGKFAGISGRFHYVTRTCVLPPTRTCHGAGRRRGVWRLPLD